MSQVGQNPLAVLPSFPVNSLQLQPNLLSCPLYIEYTSTPLRESFFLASLVSFFAFVGLYFSFVFDFYPCSFFRLCHPSSVSFQFDHSYYCSSNIKDTIYQYKHFLMPFSIVSITFSIHNQSRMPIKYHLYEVISIYINNEKNV